MNVCIEQSQSSAVTGDAVSGSAVPQPLQRVKKLAPRVAERSAEIEQARRVPSDLLKELTDAGCFRMLVPRAYGGEELSLPDALRVIETLSQADASTGWIGMIGSHGPLLLSLLPRTSFEQVYATGPDVTFAGALAPKGGADAVEGGYRVTGRWPFASGCQHAAWLVGHCVVLESFTMLLRSRWPECNGQLGTIRHLLALSQPEEAACRLDSYWEREDRGLPKVQELFARLNHVRWFGREKVLSSEPGLF